MDAVGDAFWHCSFDSHGVRQSDFGGAYQSIMPGLEVRRFLLPFIGSSIYSGM